MTPAQALHLVGAVTGIVDHRTLRRGIAGEPVRELEAIRTAMRELGMPLPEPPSPPAPPEPRQTNVERLVEHARTMGREISLEQIERFCAGEYVGPPSVWRWLLDAKCDLRMTITLVAPHGSSPAHNLQVDTIQFLPPPPEPDPDPSVVEECIGSGRHGRGVGVERVGQVARWMCCRMRYEEPKPQVPQIVRDARRA